MNGGLIAKRPIPKRTIPKRAIPKCAIPKRAIALSEITAPPRPYVLTCRQVQT